MVAAGRILHIRDIFHFIPKTVVAHDLGINNVRFSKMIKAVEEFSLKDLLQLAKWLEMEPSTLLRLVLDQHAADKKMKWPQAQSQVNVA